MSHNPPSSNLLGRRALLREAVSRPTTLAPMLDRLTQLAAKLLNVPSAYVVLGDGERPMILSAASTLAQVPAPKDLLYAYAMFKYAQPGQPLRDDIRIALTPDLTIAAFGCAELLTTNGSPIGSVCVADNAQRAWSANDQSCLADLATLVAQMLEAHCDLLEQTEAAARARRAQAELEQRLVDELGQREALAYALVEAQKRESLSTLASGIAHHFNNLLATILGNAELALIELPADSPARAIIVPITTATQRAAALNRQMLMYTGQGNFLLQPLDANELIADISDLLGASVARRVTLTITLAPNLPAVVADAAQMRQALAQLMTNAAEAIGDANGTISVTTSVCELDQAVLSTIYHAPDLPAGTYVALAVGDDGAGMDAATCARIFDPFFTTKFPGRGLGLAAVLGVVRGLRGAIRVESAPGRGTIMRMAFPAIAGPTEAINLLG
ncbi:MAG: ATP-binding protein [Roseiflexaceae bacterium]